MTAQVQQMLAEHFFTGAALGFLLGVTLTLIAVLKWREWDEKRFEQKWHVRRYGRRI